MHTAQFTNHYFTPAVPQLREELQREAQKISRNEQEGTLSLENSRREVKRREDAVQDDAKEVEAMRKAAEEAMALVRQERDGVERERDEMLKGFQDIRMALEVRYTILFSRLGQ